MRRGQRYYHFRYKGANRMCRCCPFQMLTNSRNVIETGVESIVENSFTFDALEKLIVTWESSSLHLAIACLI